MKKIILIVTWLFAAIPGWSQNVAINSDGSLPHASAILDIKSTDKGLLIPRISLISDSDVVTIANPRLSLLVYNNNAALPYGEGFYYWNGNLWSKLATRTNLANLAWNTGGNSGTNAIIDFIGTTDNRPLVFKTNNVLSGKIDHLSNNTFFGNSSGLNITNGSNNTFYGQNAGLSTTTGSANLFAGHNAGSSTTTGNSNVFLGQGAGKNNSTGSNNVFIGEDAGFNNISNSENVGIGSSALYAATTGFSNTAIGYHAMQTNTTGHDNTAVGRDALLENNTGDYNDAFGRAALMFNTTGYFNASFGSLSLRSNTTGNSNTAAGNAALYSNTTGYSNAAFGYTALWQNTTGILNTAIGASALYTNTTGDFNTAVGVSALHSNTTGYENTAVGRQALMDNSTGYFNTAVGRTALLSNTNGYKNAALGVDALRNNVSGYQNTACGNSSLVENLVGDYNTGLGYNSGPGNGLTSLNNTTAIGYNARVSSNNTMVFGDANVDRWAFGITTTNANHALEVGTNATNGNGAYLTQGGSWTNTSDINKKEDFSPLMGSELLQKIKQLTIQRWKYKGTNEYHIGPTAQQFYALFAVGTDDKAISTVDPAGIALAAIQELEKQNEALQQRISALEKAINMKK